MFLLASAKMLHCLKAHPNTTTCGMTAFCTLTSASGRSQLWQKVAVCAHLQCHHMIEADVFGVLHPKSDPDQTSSNCKAQAATSCETFTCTLNAQVNSPASCVPRHHELLKPLQPPVTSHVHTTSRSLQRFSTAPFCE